MQCLRLPCTFSCTAGDPRKTDLSEAQLSQLANARQRKQEIAKEKQDAEIRALSPKSKHRHHSKMYKRRKLESQRLQKQVSDLPAKITSAEKELAKLRAEYEHARKRLRELNGEDVPQSPEQLPQTPEPRASTSRPRPPSNEPSPSVMPQTSRRRICAVAKELQFEGAGPHWSDKPQEKRILSPMYSPDPATLALGNRIEHAIVEHAKASFQAAREMERKLAIDNLRVVQFEGETLADIWLVLDGAYSTRDIGAMKGRALASAFAAVGYHTKLMVDLEVSSKYCATCHKAEQEGREATLRVDEHVGGVCFRTTDRISCVLKQNQLGLDRFCLSQRRAKGAWLGSM